MVHSHVGKTIPHKWRTDYLKVHLLRMRIRKLLKGRYAADTSGSASTSCRRQGGALSRLEGNLNTQPEHTTFTRQRSEDADADPYVLRCPSIDVEVITAC